MDYLITIDDIINDNRVRKVEYEHELYFSIIDIFSVLLNTNRKRAQNYYHVFKRRLRDNDVNLPVIQQFKAQALDAKFYLTDFTNAEGFKLFYSHSQTNIRRKKVRIEHRENDEIINFHPKVIAFLQQQGWQTQHHIKLPSGRVIDIIACSGQLEYVIECKPQLSRSKLYTAIGQVLCYCQEYNSQAKPVIASYVSEIDTYSINCCKNLNIIVIAI